jgi:ureidoacrylate peracid hydrolase
MKSLKIPAQDAALLVIDMQNGFVHPESGMGRSAAGTEGQRKIVPAILELAGFFRGRGAPVIWSRQVHFPEDRTRPGRQISPHSAKQGFLPCLRGSWETELYGAILEAVKTGDHLVEKHRASVFFQTNLETKLKMLGTKFLFVAGCNTEFCVESTVRDAYARDFEIVVVRDAVAGIRPEFHENSLNVMEAYFAEVLSSQMVRGILL